jgi:glutaredoxin
MKRAPRPAMNALPQTLRPALLASALTLLLITVLAVAPAHAQYKVVGPDGKVTYTDRVPGAGDGKVTSITGRGGAAAADASLPLELRQPVSKFPVTLYVSSGACDPCDSARQLLRGRGIPYAEKQVVTVEDSDALERLSGGRDAPTLTIGAQTLRGLASDVWNSYLDGAGYPRESRLPRGYQYAAATPVTERRDAAAKAPAARPSAPSVAPQAEPAPAPGTTIKF